MRALLLLVLVGCSGSVPEQVCDPGHVAQCPCDDGEHGTHECLASGEGYGECSCQPTSPRSTADPEPALPEQPPTAPEPTQPPTVFTDISFDLRGMPHRGPRDVDPEMITSRVQFLMQRTRDAAGEPAPRLLHDSSGSIFRAEFYGAEAEALAQCQRAVAQVAPEIDRAAVGRRAAFREPRATPCAPIETDEGSEAAAEPGD